MSIPFTQYLLPNGQRRERVVDRSAEIEEKANELLKSKYYFEIELLTTGVVAMYSYKSGQEREVTMQLCDNGPQTLVCVDKLINDTYEHFKGE